MAEQKAGIYLNTQSNKVRRVGVGVNAPGGQEWVKITDDPNAGLLAIRDEAKKKGLGAKPEEIQWDF
ncbi:MAG: hypothetical protein HYY02_06575 [Chloroflexi bacterium]|nr:hypothetical protein [Chloroflexota bacterium]